MHPTDPQNDPAVTCPWCGHVMKRPPGYTMEMMEEQHMFMICSECTSVSVVSFSDNGRMWLVKLDTAMERQMELTPEDIRQLQDRVMAARGFAPAVDYGRGIRVFEKIKKA